LTCQLCAAPAVPFVGAALGADVDSHVQASPMSPFTSFVPELPQRPPLVHPA
jgi:hypothetical protein